MKKLLVLIAFSIYGCSYNDNITTNITDPTPLAEPIIYNDSQTLYGAVTDDASEIDAKQPLDTQIKSDSEDTVKNALAPAVSALEKIETPDNTDADVFKPTELPSPPLDVIKEKKADVNAKITKKIKQVPPAAASIKKQIKKIDAPALKSNLCSDGEILTVMKDGSKACCPKGESVCYPIINIPVTAPVAKLPKKNPKCGEHEVLTKMTNGKFACCPSGEAVCYPVIE